MELTNDWYLVLSVIMFTIGATGCCCAATL